MTVPDIKLRIVLHHTADSELSSPDARERLSAEELEGLVFMGDERCGHYRATAHLLAPVETAAYAHAFEVTTFDDGSTLCTASSAEIDGGEGGYGGPVTVLTGTGRFKGARGSGRFQGWSDGHNAFHDVEVKLVADPQA